MNTVIVPFHDWRKILLEGFRTRDSHFIEEFQSRDDIVLIINRPTTFLEIALKRKRNLIKGEVILSKGHYKLYKHSENTFIIDCVSNDIFGQVTKNYRWFIDMYGSDKLISFINQSIDMLGIKKDYTLLNQNIFASKLSSRLKPKMSIFDAWDNFVKFDVYNKINHKIVEGYNRFSNVCNFWITNSTDNISEFRDLYKVQEIHLVKNGVDVARFATKSENMPKDLNEIKRPIVGFGGKITHLLDVDLINETTQLSPNVSFVFVGQILDKSVFESIVKRNNFHYLGDKHYEIYPDYVKNFDICTVPYVVEADKKSGANTIKVYEYLATHKKVIGTLSNGLEDLVEHVYIVKDANEFSKEVKNLVNEKKPIDLEEHSWKTKTQKIIDLIKAKNVIS
jgi:hypothetical protein